jgi:hypothetical protein
LRTRPFRPFRVERANGSVYVVRQPSQAIISGEMAFIGVLRNDACSGPDYADVAIVSLSQVTELKLLPASSGSE